MNMLLASFLLATAAAASHAQAHLQPLPAYIGRNRILLIFAPGSGDLRLQKQVNFFAGHARALKERDLLLVPVIAHAAATSSPTQPEISATFETFDSPYPTSDQQADLRSRFHIKPGDFIVLLLGKDGGEKLRQSTPLTLERLTATIDAMPMRQQDMRNPR